MKKLVCARDIEECSKQGKTEYCVDGDTIITPSAKDVAEACGIDRIKSLEHKALFFFPEKAFRHFKFSFILVIPAGKLPGLILIRPPIGIDLLQRRLP